MPQLLVYYAKVYQTERKSNRFNINGETKAAFVRTTENIYSLANSSFSNWLRLEIGTVRTINRKRPFSPIRALVFLINWPARFYFPCKRNSNNLSCLILIDFQFIIYFEAAWDNGCLNINATVRCAGWGLTILLNREKQPSIPSNVEIYFITLFTKTARGIQNVEIYRFSCCYYNPLSVLHININV